MIADIDLSAIPSEAVRKQIQQLLNLVEKLWTQLRALQEENQTLRDENNHLKGEQGKPNVKASKPAEAETNQHSSETSERKSGIVTKRAKKTKSRSTAKRWLRFERKNCQPMRSSKAMWRWWYKTS